MAVSRTLSRGHAKKQEMPTTWESETWLGRGLTLKCTWGRAVAHCATRRNLAVSIPDGVIGIFN